MEKPRKTNRTNRINWTKEATNLLAIWFVPNFETQRIRKRPATVQQQLSSINWQLNLIAIRLAMLERCLLWVVIYGHISRKLESWRTSTPCVTRSFRQSEQRGLWRRSVVGEVLRRSSSGRSVGEVRRRGSSEKFARRSASGAQDYQEQVEPSSSSS